MKIEKLIEHYTSSKDGYIWERHPNIDDITGKINEIIDKLNERNDAEPVRYGKWMKGEFDTVIKCGVCGNTVFEDNGKWKYCPHCGDLKDIGTESIVHCKDCQSWKQPYELNPQNIKKCIYLDRYTNANFYCAFGEKKNEVEE